MAPPNSRDNPSHIIRPRWTTDEDTMLKKMANKYDGANWALISKFIPGRTEKSCRHRWLNNFAPKLIQGKFTDEEDAVIIKAYAKFGSQWSRIAKELVGRTDSQIKNHWKSILRQKRVALNNKGGSSSSQSETNPQTSKRIRGNNPCYNVLVSK
nr:MYB DNA-binding protein [Fagopyrum esculentum]